MKRHLTKADRAEAMQEAAVIVGKGLVFTELPGAIDAIARQSVAKPGTVRRQLAIVETALTKARAALLGMPYDRDLVYSLIHAQHRCAELSKRLPQAKRQGGRATAQKLRAAHEALNLLCDPDCEDHKVSLTKHGAYFKLASLLYQLATNKQADLTRACTTVRQANYLAA
jgi:hypothetical protein